MSALKFFNLRAMIQSDPWVHSAGDGSYPRPRKQSRGARSSINFCAKFADRLDATLRHRDPVVREAAQECGALCRAPDADRSPSLLLCCEEIPQCLTASAQN